MKRKNWIAEATATETFSRFCAPTALASMLNISNRAAAQQLIAVPGLVAHNHVGGVNGWEWTRYLETLGAKTTYPRVAYTQAEIDKHDRSMDDYYNGRRQTEPKLKSEGASPSVARWLKQNPNAEAILHVPGHTLHARNGKVVGDTLSNKSMRRRVEIASVFTQTGD